MAFSDIVNRIGKFTADNSPVILTAIGVTGTLTTAYLTGKASFKAAELITAEQKRLDLEVKSHPLEIKEKVELVWRLYIPAAGTGLLTVACIIGANRIGTRRAAALATAYTISEKAFGEYRAKVVEKIGENKERAVRDEVAQDRVTNNPVTNREVIITSGGDVLCLDTYSGRYFKSDMETLKKAQNDVNYRVINYSYASLTDFYELIGLPRTKISDELGWRPEKMLELDISTALSDDGRPCLHIGFASEPIRNYYRGH